MIKVGLERLILQGRIWLQDSYLKIKEISGADASFTSDTPCPEDDHLYIYVKDKAGVATPYWRDDACVDHEFGDAAAISAGSITVEEVDGSPSIANATTLQFDQDVGFVVTNPGGAGIARVSLSGATPVGGEWSVLTNGSTDLPEPIYASGDVIMTHIF